MVFKIGDIKKKCSKCKDTKELTEFGKDKYSKDGFRVYCKECDTKKSKQYYQNNKEKRAKSDRIYKLKNRFNITLDDYDGILKEQNYCCYICNAHQSIFSRKLVVDHCHKTGKVRGLLCSSCNQGIGHFKDNIDSLKKAVEYLEK